MPDIECVADRFVMTDRRQAIDLATGEAVRTVGAAAGAPDDQLRWASRCADTPALLDYGRCGESSRFEAWRPSARESERQVVHHLERPVEAALAELFDGVRRAPHLLCVF